MAQDRGGLEYRIEVIDDFSTAIASFRSQLRSLKADARSSRESLGGSRGGIAGGSSQNQRRELTKQIGLFRNLRDIRRRTDLEALNSSKELDKQRQRSIKRVSSLREQAARRGRQFDRDAAEAGKSLSSERIKQEKARSDSQNRLFQSEQRVAKAGAALRARFAREDAASSKRVRLEAQKQAALSDRESVRASGRRIRARQLLRIRRQQRIEAEREARARSEGARIGGFLARRGQFIRGLLGATVRIFAVLGALAAVRIGAEVFAGVVRGSVEFNTQIEKASLGIAALFTALGTVVDAQGNAVDGSRALALAQGEARRQTALLRRDALSTASTFEELLETFQTAIGPGLQAGLNVDEIRRFSVRISQAATAIGLPQNQLAEEIRSLLQGTISARTTRIATSLGISNEDIRRAKEAGTLVEFLNTRFAAFDAAGNEALNTFEALSTNAVDAARQLLGFAGTDFFNTIKDQLRDVINLLTDVDPLTGEILPDPDALAAITPLFDGLVAGVEAYRDVIKDLSIQDLTATFEVIGDTAKVTGEILGLLTNSIARAGKAVRAFNTLFTFITKTNKTIKTFISLLTFRPEEAFISLFTFRPEEAGAGGPLNVKEAFDLVEGALAFSASDININFRSGGITGAKNGIDSLRDATGRLANVASLAARGGLTEQEKALKKIEQVSNRISTGSTVGGPGASGQRGQREIDNALNKRLLQIDKERAGIRQTLARFAAEELNNRRLLNGLSKDDVSRAAFISQQARVVSGLLSERSKILTKIAQEEEISKKQAQIGDTLAAQAAADKAKAAREELAVNDRITEAVKNSANAVASNADQQGRVNLLLENAFKLGADRAAQQRTLNDLVKEEAEIRQSALTATLNTAQLAQTRGLRSDESRAQRDIDTSKANSLKIEEAKVRLQGLSTNEEARRLQILRNIAAQEEQGIQNSRRRREILKAIAQDEATVSAVLSDESSTDQQRLVATELLRTISARQERAAALKDENSIILNQLREQAGLESQILRTSQDRVETARLEGQLTQTTKGNTGAATNAVGQLVNQPGGQLISPKGGVLFQGSREAMEAAGDAAVDQAPFIGNAIGRTIAGIINKSLVSGLILGQDDKGRVVNSFSSLFKSIADAANDAFKRLKTPAGILSLLQAGGGFGDAGTDPGGQVGGSQTGPISSGFASGGRIPRANYPASAAHFFAGGLAAGGRPAGLHPTDTVPIWAAPGEFMQPVSAVQKYGPQVMEAIRRGSVDPMSLRALAGAGRSVRRPRTGGFQTGGEVLNAASPQGSSSGGVQRAVIVSSEDQLDNLMAGSGESFLRFAQNNQEDLRAALGI